MMRSRHIPPPSGSSAEAEFHRHQARRSNSELRPKNSANAKFSQTTQGFAVKVSPPRGGKADGGWSIPDDYDPTKSYKPKDVVVVAPYNTAFTDGVTDGDPETGGAIFGFDGFGDLHDQCIPGIYVCLKAPKVLSDTQSSSPDHPRNYDVHVPNWPLPNTTAIRHEDNYWFLIALWPDVRTDCDDGEEVDRYYNSQDVPEDVEEIDP